MDVNSILDFSRNQTHSTSGNFANADIIVYANIVYKDLLKRIEKEVDENYFLTIYDEDAVADQDSYTLQTDVLSVKKVETLGQSTDTYFKQSKEVDFSELEHDLNYYLTNQPINEPVHQIIGEELYIAPRFTSDTTNGGDNNQIKYWYIPRQADLAVSGAESTVKIPVDYHYVIGVGMKQYIYAEKGKTNLKNDSKAEFEIEVVKMLEGMQGRDSTRNVISYPSGVELE